MTTTPASAPLDPATGLPELPADHFWYVTKSRLYIFGPSRHPDREWEDVPFHLSEAERAQFMVTAVDSPNPYNFSFYEVETRKVVKKVGEWKYRFFTEKFVEVEREVEEYRYLNVRVSKFESQKYGDPHSKGSLVQRAQDTLRAWNAAKEEDALLGKYPPKTLGV